MSTRNQNNDIGVIMKKSSLFILLTILVSNIFFVSLNNASANEGSCSLSDPCSNWAVVDSSGLVTNIIVCQASVCGSNGSLGGIHPDTGERFVEQTAGNSETGNVDGTAGYTSSSDGSRIVRENNGVFTIIEGKVETTIQDGVELTTNVAQSIRSFTFASSVGKMYGEIEMENISPNNNSSTTLSAKRQTTTNLILETKTFLERKTADEVRNEVSADGLNLILSKIETLLSMLGAWVKP